KASPSILASRIYDQHGNRMTPTHTNKQGARYRYYVSHAILQKRKGSGRDVMRVSAQEIEVPVMNAVREHLEGRFPETEVLADGDLIERHVKRVTCSPGMIEIEVGGETSDNDKDESDAEEKLPNNHTIIRVPWSKDEAQAVKGVLHSPMSSAGIVSHNRELLLTAIAKSRAWIEDLVTGCAASFADIAKQEGKVERH